MRSSQLRSLMSQDRAGFRRDLLPRRGDCVQGMKRCYHFVHGLPNQELRFTDSGLKKFRCFDVPGIGGLRGTCSMLTIN